MRVTEKGQVTIPKQIREKLGIRAGSEVDFVDRGEAVILERRDPKSNRQEAQERFLEWAESVRGTANFGGMDGKDYIDWMRGPRDDLDFD